MALLINNDPYDLQVLADLENHALFKDDLECQKLILEAMKYHLLPERRTLMQSPRTKPRKSTVGTLYAVGGMDNNKGTSSWLFSVLLFTCSPGPEPPTLRRCGPWVNRRGVPSQVSRVLIWLAYVRRAPAVFLLGIWCSNDDI